MCYWIRRVCENCKEALPGVSLHRCRRGLAYWHPYGAHVCADPAVRMWLPTHDGMPGMCDRCTAVLHDFMRHEALFGLEPARARVDATRSHDAVVAKVDDWLDKNMDHFFLPLSLPDNLRAGRDGGRRRDGGGGGGGGGGRGGNDHRRPGGHGHGHGQGQGHPGHHRIGHQGRRSRGHGGFFGGDRGNNHGHRVARSPEHIDRASYHRIRPDPNARRRADEARRRPGR